MLQNGARGTFALLIEDHKRILYKVARSYCPNASDRPDLIQEILIQLWLSFARYDAARPFATWMYRVALNVAISFDRKEKSRSRRLVPLPDFGFSIAATDRLEAEDTIEMKLLQKIISELDPMNRGLILLFLDGHSYEDMADALGISVTLVATRLSRLKTRLHDEFQEQGHRDKGEQP